VQKWVKYFSGGGAYDEDFLDMQRASNGNIIVTGVVSKKGSGQDWETIAYRPDGTIRWGKGVTSVLKQSDVPAALEIYGSRVYVTGSVQTDAHDTDVFAVGYALANGDTVWGSGLPWDGTDGGDDTPWDIAVSSDGVYVTGSTYTTANGNDMLTIKYEK
jgi:hypothetical protein